MRATIVVGLVALGVLAVTAFGAATAEVDPWDREAVIQEYTKGNWADALAAFRQRIVSERPNPHAVDDLRLASSCLAKLKRSDELDALLEEAVEARAKDWRVLTEVARQYFHANHRGYQVAGEVKRGYLRGQRATVVNLYDRDRVRALQLMLRARPLTGDATPFELGNFYEQLAIILHGQGEGSWALQRLTDIETLPEVEEGWGYRRSGPAPVDEDGQPVLHDVPGAFETAQSDGERWRWALTEAGRVDPERAPRMRLIYGNFTFEQFGVQTMAYLRYFGGDPTDDDAETGPFAVHTLDDDETIARLASGIRRFELPAEHHPIAIYRAVTAPDPAVTNERADRSVRESAYARLAEIYTNRRQYPKAAAVLEEAIERFGPGKHGSRVDQLAAIRGNWGRFQTSTTQVAGEKGILEYRYRNGTKVKFTARRIRVEKLLDDVVAYLRTRPSQVNYRSVDIDNFGYRLLHEGQDQYLGEQVAAWEVALEPREAHFDRIITVETPVEKAGAYWVEAQMQDGNRCFSVLWITDTVIVERRLDEAALYFLADARTGEPVPGMKLDFFGYEQTRKRGREYELTVDSFKRQTDDDGQVILRNIAPNHNWLIRASNDAGRFAYQGFSSIWLGKQHPQNLDEVRSYAITDRPIYRPQDTVDYKVWVQNVRFVGRDGANDFSGRKFNVQIRDPEGNVVSEETKVANRYGGVSGTFLVEPDARLGQYFIVVEEHGGAGTFRVEEYRKPEFEVKVTTPEKPIALGETAKVEISARYFFGTPVREGTVRYTVERSTAHDAWYPPRPWDWLYRSGYGFLGAESRWHPGFEKWGCIRPYPTWYPYRDNDEELVMEGEALLGPDGTFEIELDTRAAQALHGDSSHRYVIRAEVVDASRRTIEGRGEVLVAKEPFSVFAWLDRGFYRAGDSITAHAKAVTLDGKPVETKGTARLYRLSYPNGELRETEVASEAVESGADGEVEVTLPVREPGQYRIGFTLQDAAGREREGARVFSVRDTSLAGEDFRFNPLELVVERREYAPGDSLELLINTDQAKSTVLLFVRPEQGVYSEPEVIRMGGKSALRSIPVTAGDQPNFFVEALTIANGQLHVELVEVAVPPADRKLEVTVTPGATELKPGEGTALRVEVKDSEGRPFVGDTTLAVYDAAVEAIVGGSNVPNILEHFWSFRRYHYPRTDSTLSRWFRSETAPHEPSMADLGVFGHETWTSDVRTRTAAPATRSGETRSKLEMADEDGAGAFSLSGDDEGGGDGEDWVEPDLRSEFVDTALWVASVTTDANGTATVDLELPDNLTTWKIRVWSLGRETRVGEAKAEIVARKNLLVRLQAPRFFLERDEVVVSAVVHNELESAKAARVSIELDDSPLELLDEAMRTVRVDAHGEVRVDWRVRVTDSGEAKIRMLALTDEESDAVEMTFPVHVYGAPTQLSFSGSLRPDESTGVITFEVPDERRVDDTRLEIRYSPSLAAAMVDALPYLVEYPYGCTEQTLNRFLPSVLVRSVLDDLDLDLEAIAAHRANLNAQEMGELTGRAKRWRRFGIAPVFDDAKLDEIVRTGVDELVEMQLSDGGWGWFSGYGERSYPHTTALVVRGLALARQHGVTVPKGVLDRGYEWLQAYQAEQLARLALPQGHVRHKSMADHVDAWVAFVLAEGGRPASSMLDYLMRDRTRMTPYGLGLIGLTAHLGGRAGDRDLVIENISQFEVSDDSNQTLYLRLGSDSWWRWYGSEFETQACYLKLLALTNPRGEKARRLVKYLLNNRKHATYWNSTRDTALCLEAFVDFLKGSDELSPDYELDVVLDGQVLQTVSIRKDNLFQFKDRVVLEGRAVTSGEHRIELRKRGKGPLYFNAYVATFSREEEIPPAGLEIQVTRKVYRLHRRDKTVDTPGAHGQALEQEVIAYRREELASGAQVESGDLLEVELTIESKNDYEYLLFEDFKAAGCEPVEALSGYNGNELGAYCEFRDRTVSFFVHYLPRGRRSVSYRLRAETPGIFSAMPAQASAMYAPELRGNSANTVLKIEDAR